MKFKHPRTLSSSVRNILFWLLLTYFHFSGHRISSYFILVAAIFLSYGLGGYLHNDLLIPRYLMRSRYLPYLLYSFALIVINSYLAYYTTHFLNHRYNNLEIQAAANGEHIYYFVFTTIFTFILLAFGKFIQDAMLNQRKIEEKEKKQLESELGSL